MRCAVGITFECDGRHPDRRKFGKSLFQIVEFGLALSNAKPPAIIVHDDADMIWVGECSSSAIEGGIIEVPLRRRELPDQPCKVVRVPLVASPAALRREIVLVPPVKLRLRWQRYSAGLLAADQITADGDHGLTSLWP